VIKTKLSNYINFCSRCGHDIKYNIIDISFKGYSMRIFGYVCILIFGHSLPLKILNYIKKKKNLYNKSD